MITESEFTVKGHGVHTAYLELTEALKKQPNLEVVVNDNKPADIYHIHSVGPYSLAKINRRRGKKVVSAHIVPDSLVGSIVGGKTIKPLSKAYLKSFYKKADLVLACSDSVAEELQNDMGLTNVVTFYNSIDTSRYRFSANERQQARQKFDIKDNQFVVVGNGQIQPRKRFDLFVELAENNPQVRFFWVGGMPFKALASDSTKMNRLINKAPTNLTITGVIELEDVKQYYAIADLFILPSEQENHPMCVIEAAAAGLPILLRDIYNYDETFKPNVALAKTDQEFDDQLKKFAKMDGEELAEWTKKSAKIAQRFGSQTAAQKLVKLYQELLA